MKNLFYTEKDNTLFWIAGYTMDDNTSLVLEKIESLKNNMEEFASVCEAKLENIRTVYVNKSSKYKNMRVFYVVDPPAMNMDTYHLNADWDMWKWLEN